jgi:hypothetical protein
MRYHQAAATDNQPKEKHAAALSTKTITLGSWQNERGEPNSDTTKKQSDFSNRNEQDLHKTWILVHLIIGTQNLDLGSLVLI